MMTVLPTPAPPNIPIFPPCTYGSRRSMTLMPVSNIWVLASSSSKGGGSRWMGHRSSYVIVSAATSSGSPRTLYTCPKVPGPTGTVIGWPVFSTGVPRTSPSVGLSAIVRTTPSPMCCATSQVMTSVSPSSVRSTRTAVFTSGKSSMENSMSTTGPITRTTRPLPFPSSSAISLIPSRSSRLVAGGRAERLGRAHDVHDLRGDLGLTGLVRHPSQHLGQLLRVLGGGLHGPSPVRVLRRRRLEQRGVDLRDHVLGQELVQDRRGLGLEDVLGVRLAELPANHLLGCDRQEAPVGRPSGERRAEVRVRRVDLVDPVVGEGIDERPADLLGDLIGRDLAVARPAPLDGEAAESEVPQALPPRHVDDRLDPPLPQAAHEILRSLQDVRVVGAGQPPVGGHHQHGGSLRLRALLQERVDQGSGLPGDVLHGPREQLGVGPSRLHPLLRLEDAGRRDQLHGLGDLLRGLDGADPPPNEPELRAHPVSPLRPRPRPPTTSGPTPRRA